MNSTSAWYAHTDQWRYETLTTDEILSPTAPEGDWDIAMIDYNIRAERMGWLPSAPQLRTNPLMIAKSAREEGKEIPDYVTEQLKSGKLSMSCEDPDAPENWPRNLFVWRSNLLGSSGKGHEYFLKHLLGTDHGVLGRDLGEEGRERPKEAKWHEEAPRGKLDLLVCIDFRMSTTAVYSDVVLPTASWYEKNDLNTSGHASIHSSAAGRRGPRVRKASRIGRYSRPSPASSRKSRRRSSASKPTSFSLPILHDTPAEIAQDQVKDWKKGECDLIPGKTAPNFVAVERDYTAIGDRFCALGPLMDKIGNGGKGISWETGQEVQHLRELNGVWEDGPAKGCPKIVTGHRCERGRADARA